MSYYFRAVAVDYDGTLTNGARPADEVLAAVEQLRSEGPKVVLCTGRVLADLLNVFPEVYDHFDAIVAENGAAIATARTGERDLAEPVSAQLEQALSRHGIPVKRGRVLLDTFAVYAHIVLEEVEQLGLDCQLIRNRGALMVLPSGVTKGTGLIELLGELGISRHSTVGIGDAENDHALLDACELGVAVSNAVPSLQARADIVLAEPDGAGLVRFLRGPVMRGELQVHPRHWRVDIGRFVDGSPVLVPASGINVLVSGETGAGKSYLAGLFAERLITLGYSLCIFDPEGDYGSLGRLSPVLVTGGPAGLPEPRQLVQLLHHRFMSVVIDLSMVSIEQKRAYYRDAGRELRRLRAEAGLPHWVFIDEADQLTGGQALPKEEGGLLSWGFCLVTHNPDALGREALGDVDYTIARSDGSVWRPGGVSAVLEAAGERRSFVAARRLCPHLRHWHKYLHGGMPVGRRFYFRSARGLSGLSAGSVTEFQEELRRCDENTLAHHLQLGDFSRWLEDVLRETSLAQEIRAVEEEFRSHGGEEDARRTIMTAIERLVSGDSITYEPQLETGATS